MMGFLGQKIDGREVIERTRKPHWSVKKKYLSDCTCGAKQEDGDIAIWYAGAGEEIHEWTIECKKCGASLSGTDPEELIRFWNMDIKY